MDLANILSKANFFYQRTGQHGFQLFLRDNLIHFLLLFNKSFYAVGEKKKLDFSGQQQANNKWHKLTQS